MNQKTQRFATIRKIIRSELIGSQDELIARLRECGVEITQSTLSRDLKFMNVAKIPHKSKGYVYVLPNTAHHDVNVSSNISDNITSLTFSGNLGVLKTKSGYASAISVPIDNLDCPGILGTIARTPTATTSSNRCCGYSPCSAMCCSRIYIMYGGLGVRAAACGDRERV